MMPKKRRSLTPWFVAPFTMLRTTANIVQGNKIESTKKKAKLSSAELRKKKKDRMAR
jgi:hypothetical protein